MTKLVGVMVTAAALLSGAPAALAQDQVPCAAPRLTDLMTAREADAAGLRQLSEAQLEALSAWVESYRAMGEWLVAGGEDGEAMAVPGSAVESTIDGDFDGWVGNTVFRLANGQIWQQTSRSARYLFAHAPRVVISTAPHRMRVDGIPVEISVRRLR